MRSRLLSWIFTSVVFFLLLQQGVVVYGASTDSFYFTKSPQNQDVEEGHPVRLECAVQPNDDIHYSWLQDGSRIDPDRENGRRYLEGESHLRILHADRDVDPGRYQCQALNKTSKFVSASREASINVYWMEPDVHVQLVRPSRIEEIQIDSEVELACVVKAQPQVTMDNIIWLHNGNGRLPGMQALPNGNLRIASFGIQHVGSFHCHVRHPAGVVDSRPPFFIQMTVDEPPQVDASVDGKNFLKYALPDRPLQLVCPRPPPSPDAPPDTPVITVWGFMKRLGEQQQATSNLPAVRLHDGDSTLIIDRFKPIHINFYVCEVEVPATSERYVYVFQVYLAELYTPKPSNFAPRPRQNQPLAVRMGEKLELRYYADLTPTRSYTEENISNPPPRIEWFRLSASRTDPTKIPQAVNQQSEDQMRVYVKHGGHLIIKNANEGDNGPYEMVLSSIAGRVSVPFQLMVSFPPEFDMSQESLSPQTLDEGEPLTLSCHIRRRAIPGSRIYWEKDGRPLINYGNDILVEGDGERLRLPRVMVDHQGRYQCFVLTNGYSKKFPGQVQQVEVRGRLQFVRELKEHFLELNVQGRLTCKVRGYGQLEIDWFRKAASGLEPIKRPNLVENGVLIFHYVQNQDAGEYVCVARSNYRDGEIQMNVKVIVGEKPRIIDMSANQTIQEGSRMLLNCKVSGDPRPQISWIVKKPNNRDPFIYTAHLSGQPVAENDNLEDAFGGQATGSTAERVNVASLDDRVQVLSNGSLVINRVLLKDEAEYICIAGNKHAIQTRQGVYVSVLTPDEYAKLEHGEEGVSPGMVRTIVIVVNCAIAYLGLIFGLAVYCSMRYLRKRRNRAQNAKSPEAGHLIKPGGPSQDNNCALLLNEEMMTAGSRAPTGSPNDTTATDLALMQNFGYRNAASNNGSASGKTYHPSGASFQMTEGPSHQLYPQGSYSAADMPMMGTTPKNGGVAYPVSTTSTATGGGGGGSGGGPRMVSAPPPTPLSHFGGLSSSGNSASAYSQSISGVSNSTGLPCSGPGGYVLHGGGGPGMIPNGGQYSGL